MILNNSSRGLLIEDEKILFIEYRIDKVTYYALPGGSVETGENLSSCVEREFLEETGIEVETKQLILVNEFINPKPKYVAKSWKNGIHQIETIFLVERKSSRNNAQIDKKYDFGMQGIKWLSKDELTSVKYYPELDTDWFFSVKELQNIYLTKKEIENANNG